MKFVNEQLVPFVAWLLISIIGKTSIVRKIEHKDVKVLKEKKKSFIYAFWHNRLLYLTYSHRQQNICAMVSQSKDGEYISRVLHKFGFKTIRGSSTRGGRRAFVEMLRKLRENKMAAIAPDGPRGPANKVQSGVIYLAQRSGCPIVPLSYGMKRKKVLSSWDRFIVPFPFNKGVVITGAPIYVKVNDNLREKICELEKSIDKIGQEADILIRE